VNQDQLKPTQESIAAGEQLLDRDLSQAYGFLGIQAERLEIAEGRLARGRPVPEWSDADVYKKVLTDDRATLDDLKRYVTKGKDFVDRTVKQLEPKLRALLCQDYEIRPEIQELESDAKTLLGHLAAGMVGVIAVNLPAGVAGAAASIATVLAVIVIRNGLGSFCKLGADAIVDQD